MGRAQTEPPVMLDGARVLELARFEATGRESAPTAVVGGVPVEAVAGLVIAEDLVEGGVFLLHCTDEWFTLAAEHHEDANAAKSAVASAYAGRTVAWQPFRPLTSAEEREVETTRAFLREIAGK